MNDQPRDDQPAVLSVSDLTVRFKGAPANVVDGVSFAIRPGRTLAIVGESGCGKSVTSMALMGLLPDTATVDASASSLLGEPLLGMSDARLLDVRGNRMAMIFQEPMTSLNPVFTIGEQIAESVIRHQGLSAGAARQRALEMLEKVRVPDAQQRLDAYPHELSGGMRQRVAIARSLVYEPDVLLMDEPFAALDAQTRESLQDELLRIWDLHKKTIVFITHSLDEAIFLSDRVAVMTPRPGRVKEIIDIDLARPRVPQLRNSHAFVQLRQRAWTSLREAMGAAVDELALEQALGRHESWQHVAQRSGYRIGV